ncbi:UbiA family prenyltransferase [Luteibacter aegosomaticola]|uniref:UbiA family prenyltransferase n=1 Tax=Luteibacter aegosomaticola TaxID=2911538 RepID=UPI001FF82DF7|nr:UbiA family prenyltransferase [Luteibacter aegosomaticola]UPG91115.1 UbiA family prenyltransferase [Luteibacter aegosomaticola]
METARPLCIDLDGTLVHTDLLVESALALLHRNPLYAFCFIAWLLRGKARLKAEIAKRVVLDVSLLPYNHALTEWIAEHGKGRQVTLVTASDATLAKAVAGHLGIFSTVMASDGTLNLAGKRKAQALVEHFGERGFDYAGNHRVDLDVWKHAHTAIVVSSSHTLAGQAGKVAQATIALPTLRPTLRTWAKALRVHQWLKNTLVFIPWLASHRLFDTAAATHAIAAFFCFSFCASGVYLLNDLLDLDADRAHRSKKHRPFAAGRLSLVYGLVGVPVLTVAAFVLAILATPPAFAIVLAAYLAVTLLYSFKAKAIAGLDVMLLAGLYTVRIVGGTFAIISPLSFWLLAFSMFIFLSLAILKRCVELGALVASGKEKAKGRGYVASDLALILPMGVASGYLSVLVLALYINSNASMALYRKPEFLWLACPCLLYWVTRAWLVAHRGKMQDDPIVFAVTDRVSQITLAIAGVLVLLAV